MRYYPYILGVIDKLNDWNDKLNDFSAEHLDNVGAGVVILGIILFVSMIGINTLNKK